VTLDGAVGSIADTAPNEPWLNSLVGDPGADLARVLEQVVGNPRLDRLAVWTCAAEQAQIAGAAGFSELLARLDAMAMELGDPNAGPGAGAGEPISLAEAGAVNDAAYDNRAHELERTLARIGAEHAHAFGRRDDDGRLIAALVLLEVDGDCSVQYVATRQHAQRKGHGRALLCDALAWAHRRGCGTSTLQASEAGAQLYRSLGYRTLAPLQLRRRP
jgi:GNAT superfamily N-acetyltransferase